VSNNAVPNNAVPNNAVPNNAIPNSPNNAVPGQAGAPSPGEKIAAELRRSPIYVDPSLAEALPRDRRARLMERMRRSPIPIFIVIVPLVRGGTWDDPDELITVVHDRFGRDGAYITMDEFDGGLTGRQFGGPEEQQRNTRYAVLTQFHQEEMRNATLADRLLRAVDLIVAGRGQAEYEAATADLGRGSGTRRGTGTGTAEDGFPVLPVALGGVAVAAVAGLVIWRARRGARVERAEHPLLLPRAVLDAAKRANEDELRDQAHHEVIAFGELLDESEIDTSRPEVTAAMTRALDAYQAAGKVLDAADGVPDLAGVLVLVDRGRDALASARSLAEGGGEIPPSPLCFFNPLHGDAHVSVDWRPIGQRDRLRVQACRACAKAVRAHRAPEFLTARAGERIVPYFEVEGTLWAETGYGQLRDDLVRRVLRGDLRR
jgi:hypothetical protein